MSVGSFPVRFRAWVNSWSYLFGQKIIEYLCLSGQSTVLGTGNTEVNDSKPWVNERGLLLCLEKIKIKMST